MAAIVQPVEEVPPTAAVVLPAEDCSTTAVVALVLLSAEVPPGAIQEVDAEYAREVEYYSATPLQYWKDRAAL